MKGKKRKIQFLVLMLAEAVLLTSLIITIFIRNNMVINTAITDWSSNYVEYDNGWYVDESIVETKDTIDIICGPYIDVKAGTYSVTMEYECDYDQSCLVYANSGKDAYLKTELKKLRSNQQSISYNFVLTREIDNLEVVVKYNGRGALLVKNIEIKPDMTGLWKNMAIFIFFCVIIDLCVFFYSKRKWPQILLLAETGAIFFLAAAIVIQNNEEDTAVAASITDWKSEYIEYNDGWYVDKNIAEAGGMMENDISDLISGPHIALKKGTYTVKVDYECDMDQTCRALTDYIAGVYIKTGENNILSRNQTSVSFDFTATEDIENFEVTVQYNGQGSLKIENIEIYRNTVGLQRMLVIVVLLSLCIDICFCFRKKIKANKMLILKICGIILLVSCPLFARGIGSGHDIDFHFMRIEGLAEELRRGIFPVRMSSLWMDGYGYPVSIYYGDIILYIAAVLRMTGFPIVTVYKSYVFLVNAGTVIISYSCFKKIFKSEEAAFLTSLAYATASYRIMCIYVRSAVGEYSAMMFLPLIALAIHQFYTLDSDDWKSYKRNALVMAVGMSGVIGCHILSTEMVVVTLALLCIVLWKSTLKKYILRGYALAVIETIILSAYFVIPFLDYYRNIVVTVNNSIDDIKIIQRLGAYIIQYFSFFQDMFGGTWIDLPSRASFTPGPALMAALVIAIIIWVKGKVTKEIKIYLSFSVFLLFVASNLFPWNYLGMHYRWGKMLSAVQFPWRYIGMAVIFMTMLLGAVYKLAEQEERYQKKLYTFIISACVIMSIFHISNYSNNITSVMRYDYDTIEINTYSYGGGEYLRAWTDTESFTGEIAYENMQKVSLLSRDGTHMELYCVASETNGTVDLPMLNYKGYQVIDEYGNRYEIVDGPNNVIQFSVPAGFVGKITVDFVEPWFWRLGEAVSLLAVLVICVYKARKFLPVEKFRIKMGRQLWKW